MNKTTNPHTGKTNSWVLPLTKILNDNGLASGRMISFSKSTYRNIHPNGTPYFNACIYAIGNDNNPVQVWWGDLDVTFDMETLQKIANEYGKPFYITTEKYRMDFKKTSKKELEKGLKKKYDFQLPVIKITPK